MVALCGIAQVTQLVRIGSKVESDFFSFQNFPILTVLIKKMKILTLLLLISHVESKLGVIFTNNAAETMELYWVGPDEMHLMVSLQRPSRQPLE